MEDGNTAALKIKAYEDGLFSEKDYERQIREKAAILASDDNVLSDAICESLSDQQDLFREVMQTGNFHYIGERVYSFVMETLEKYAENEMEMK